MLCPRLNCLVHAAWQRLDVLVAPERERERDEVRSGDEMNEERAYLYTTMFFVALAVAS